VLLGTWPIADLADLFQDGLALCALGIDEARTLLGGHRSHILRQVRGRDAGNVDARGTHEKRLACMKPRHGRVLRIAVQRLLDPSGRIGQMGWMGQMS
jgi:hypothetical protein